MEITKEDAAAAERILRAGTETRMDASEAAAATAIARAGKDSTIPKIDLWAAKEITTAGTTVLSDADRAAVERILKGEGAGPAPAPAVSAAAPTQPVRPKGPTSPPGR